MKNKYDIETLNKIPILDVAKELGLPVKNKMALCFLHEEKTPSLSFDTKTNRWRCFGCSQGGSVIDLVMGKNRLDFLEACAWLGNRFYGMNADIHRRQRHFSRQPKTIRITTKDKQISPIPVEPDYALYTEVVAYLNLSKKAELYLSNTRGLSLEVIRLHDIVSIEDIDGFYGWLLKSFERERLLKSGLFKKNERKMVKLWWRPGIVFPYYDITGRVANLQMRPYETNQGFKYIFLSNVRTCMYNERSLIDLPRGSTVIICEGAIDTLSILTERPQGDNLATVGLPGVTNLTDEWVDRLSYFNISIIFDNDQAGQAKALEYECILKSRNINVQRITLESKYKDVNERLIAKKERIHA